jgi:hypothetical protein
MLEHNRRIPQMGFFLTFLANFREFILGSLFEKQLKVFSTGYVWWPKTPKWGFFTRRCLLVGARTGGYPDFSNSL